MFYSRSHIKRKPARGTLARYRERIVEVMGEARTTRHDPISDLCTQTALSAALP